MQHLLLFLLVALPQTNQLNLREASNQFQKSFTNFDKDGDGSINIDELGTLFNTLTKEELQEKIDDADTDGNGIIHFPEYLTMMAEKEFGIYDMDGDGFITKEELREKGEELGGELSEEELDDMMWDDMDGDGFITKEELRKGWKELHAKKLSLYEFFFMTDERADELDQMMSRNGEAHEDVWYLSCYNWFFMEIFVGYLTTAVLFQVIVLVVYLLNRQFFHAKVLSRQISFQMRSQLYVWPVLVVQVFSFCIHLYNPFRRITPKDFEAIINVHIAFNYMALLFFFKTTCQNFKKIIVYFMRAAKSLIWKKTVIKREKVKHKYQVFPILQDAGNVEIAESDKNEEKDDEIKEQIKIVCAFQCESNSISNGYIENTCTEKCILKFHPKCWVQYKKQYKIKAMKTLLGQNCSTEDCWGAVNKILWKDKFGIETREIKLEKVAFEKKENKLLTKNVGRIKQEKTFGKIIRNISNSHIQYIHGHPIDDHSPTKNDLIDVAEQDRNVYNPPSIFLDDIKLILKRPKNADPCDKSEEKKKRKKNQYKKSMSLGEYQEGFLGQHVRRDLRFASFSSVLMEIKQNFNLTNKEAKKHLISLVGSKKYIETNKLDQILAEIAFREQEQLDKIGEGDEDEEINETELELTLDDPEVEVCTICYDEVTKDFESLVCGHKYHGKCIRTWFRQKTQCPLCREVILLPDVYPPLCSR